MPFFKELRRRSRASFRTSESSSENASTVPTQKSSSTLSSSLGSSTPSSSHPANLSSTTLPNSKPNVENMIPPPVPPRPAPMPHSNRNSMIALSPTGSTLRVPPPTSMYAPRITSIIENSVVHQKVLLIYGEIGDPQARQLDGNITVHHDKDGLLFPPTNWPVSDSCFKALVYLSPGWNKLRFDFTSPKLSNGSNGQTPTFHSSYMMLNYLPLNSTPPLQLAIIIGKDSPCTFDATPGRIRQEGNDLSIAVRKFRMAAHLWQSFTAEQMYRNKLGRRCFRFEEEWQVGTLSIRDWETSAMKNEARVHIVRCPYTVAELRSLNLPQRHDAVKDKDLFIIATEAIKEHFNIRGAKQKQYVAALFLDTHWNKEADVITALAALGGGGDDLGLAIFGSHALQSYPSCIEEVVPAFMDCTKTDLNYVANDAGESGSSWEAANIGIGAHLHEIGHLLGSPHQPYGMMLRDFVHLNRTFCIREPYSTRTKSPGLRCVKAEDECVWHRMDTLRFRYHPCFRLPSDELLAQDDTIQFFAVGGGKLILLAPTGIPFIEMRTDGDDICHHWIEYLSPDPRNSNIPRQVIVTETEIRAKLPEDKRKAKVQLRIFAGSSRSVNIDDLAEAVSKANIVNLPPIRPAPKRDEGLTMNAYNNVMGLGKTFETRQGYKSLKLGASAMEGSQPQELILESATLQSKLLRSVIVYSGGSLDGLEFCYEDGTTQLFGKRGGKPGGDEFFLDTRRGETILGFNLRAGAWIDGIEILTSSGRRSGMFGNPQGGSAHTLMTPRGYSLAGVAGSCGPWIDGFQIIITR